jgi:hypothetical protein
VHGIGQRAAARLGIALGVTRAHAPHAFIVLGQVQELEPGRQRAHEQLHLLVAHRADEGGELVGGGLVARP